ncbi:helix-turn-helix domain-containing protein [Streptococcus sp. HMSC077D04]|jgi:conserved domain protein|uniref:helix-turn-helix domain-containing protein n=1 Tax=Streptococcus sp. HMSC077D04 TaxID=1715180 RepID=UPI0008A1EF5E|nr:helix-turn-helix transcriptional regulator [Streptococcus sp. HMSC077D04]HEV6150808.1 helix-turn-helix transcriptional regulator [Streptococcus pneumoniae]OFN95258.1 transcriptional regulator [Streptococcus sp. HMSC077D04]HEV6241171.1 helix-turn-helix transcriptional regulator [Streptococcus pneumoniae]HEV6256862.1 helix-turn-helix transcriptional regulator [Streptococcus pneumoniae]HEV6274786.1 helix-turn-helix transcriptional regulator [Streptococcus pneumoniae]
MLKRIRDLREDTDLTQEYVAKIVLNCTRSAYSKMESGSRLISIDDLVKLADFYKVSLDYLVGRVDNKEGYYFKK